MYGSSTAAPAPFGVTPWDMYRVKPPLVVDSERASADRMPGIERSAGPTPDDGIPLWHPHSPLFWFGVIAATTFGLVFVSSTVRVGPFRASAAVGKP